ncbi:MAG: ABC transporter ATP-binding protein/permease [Bacilli bacterium]|nr:ABC transporter ATP-binding protein/permease [Bacilli bacterium]
MALIELNSVSKCYKVNKTENKYVLKDVTLSFPETGLVSILGKSGSGKSTLLNLIGKLDDPSNGVVYFNGDNIAKYKEKKLTLFRKNIVSYIFQHYHLLENQTALYNVMLPCLLKGDSFSLAKRKVLSLIDDFSIDEVILNKRCSLLSGGEKERIAIMRAFINEPQVLLADEPTGALDKDNALLVMESLRKASEHSLVIVVTHNEQLARQYSDRIIHMKDGKVIYDEKVRLISGRNDNKVKRNLSGNPNWYNKIIASNFIKRFKRNIFSLFALMIGIVASMIIFGFSNGAHHSISVSTEKQFDYGVASISKENKIKSDESPITLIQTLRSSEEEIQELKYEYDFLHYCLSYDYLVSPALETFINEDEIQGLTYTPVYSFIDSSIDKSLLVKGKIPSFNTLNQVVINQTAYDYLKKETKSDPLHLYLHLKDNKTVTYYTDDLEKPYITDYFTYDRLVEIVGVVKELTFLNTPKIYYPYVALDKYLNETFLNNLSEYQGQISWKERIMFAQDNEFITSYSHKVFLKNSGDVYKLKEMKEKLNDKYSLNSNALTIEETLFQLVDAASVGMEVFLVISLVGTMMIIGIISFASYNEDIKESAVLLSLGAKMDDVAALYLFENFLLGIISLVLSFIITTFIEKPLNSLIEHFTTLIDIVDIPFKSFMGKPFLFPLIIIVSALFICLIATYLPIMFSKKISLKEVLNTND